jgi:hypothetical protein
LVTVELALDANRREEHGGGNRENIL